MKNKNHYATVRLTKQEHDRVSELGEAFGKTGLKLGVSAILRLLFNQAIKKHDWSKLIEQPAKLLEVQQ